MEIATAVKAAAVAVKNRGSLKKIIGAAALAMIAPFFLCAALFMQIMSAFEPDGVLMSAQYADAEQSAIYKSLQAEMIPYYEALKEELTEERLKTVQMHTEIITVEKENTEEDTENDDTGNEAEEEIIVMYPSVIRKLNYIPENIMIAYLLMKDGIETSTAKVNSEMLKGFLDNISSIKEYQDADDEDTYWIENKLLTVSEIAELYFTDETDRSQFKILCETYGEYFDVGQTKVIYDDGSEVMQGTVLESYSDVPLYLQYDAAWADFSYGNGTMKRNGCCPTCLAMVFSYFRGEAVYPADIAAWAGSRYYVSGAGTAWSIFAPASERWGVACTNIGKDQVQMRNALQSGKLIIASMGPGTFTKGGHFIVLTGITADGKIKVNDPNDSSIKNHAGMEFEISLILRECKNMWVFG